MQNSLLPGPVPSSHPFGSGIAPRHVTRPAPQAFEAEARADHQFVDMLNAYRDSGGLARCAELLGLLMRRRGSDVATLGRWIAGREVICFEWQSHTWFPLFQFGAVDFAPDRRLRPILAELACVYHPWAVATWFASVNPWLGERLPVDLLDSDPAAVLRAAQAARSAIDAACAGQGQNFYPAVGRA